MTLALLLSLRLLPAADDTVHLALAPTTRLLEPVSYLVVADRHLVQSGTLAAIGYDARSRTLEVEFRSGAVYQYYDVPEKVYRGLLAAPSHGSYLAAYVKKAKYRYREVR